MVYTIFDVRHNLTGSCKQYIKDKKKKKGWFKQDVIQNRKTECIFFLFTYIIRFKNWQGKWKAWQHDWMQNKGLNTATTYFMESFYALNTH